MEVLTLAFKSLINRRLTVLLTVFSISLSVLLLLGVEKLRTEAKNSFTNTISGTDLIVGARTGATQLLLYSIFHIGDATNNISWQSYQEISKFKRVKWAVPVTLGDSHQSFRVMGTSPEFFQYYRFANRDYLDYAAETHLNFNNKPIIMELYSVIVMTTCTVADSLIHPD